MFKLLFPTNSSEYYFQLNTFCRRRIENWILHDILPTPIQTLIPQVWSHMQEGAETLLKKQFFAYNFTEKPVKK